MLYCHLSIQMTLPFRFSSRLLFYFLAGLLLLLSVVTAVGERGAIHLWRLRGDKILLDEQNYRLQKENKALQQRIYRIRHDNHYLEKLAREELNMVRPGEVVYRFPGGRAGNVKDGEVSAAPSESRASAGQKGRRSDPQ